MRRSKDRRAEIGQKLSLTTQVTVPESGPSRDKQSLNWLAHPMHRHSRAPLSRVDYSRAKTLRLPVASAVAYRRSRASGPRALDRSTAPACLHPARPDRHGTRIELVKSAGLNHSPDAATAEDLRSYLTEQELRLIRQWSEVRGWMSMPGCGFERRRSRGFREGGYSRCLCRTA